MQYFCCNAPIIDYIEFIAPAGNGKEDFNQARAEYAEGGGSLSAGIRPRRQRMIVMAEIQSTAPKSKPKPVAAIAADSKFEMPKFEIPKFDMPKFEMPSMEVPPAFREVAEKGIAQAKDNYDKLKSAAEQASEVLEETYATASKGCSGYGLKLIETTRANSNAAFDLFGELLTAKSYSEVVELTTAYMRTQFDTVTAQAKELTEHAQKVATETVEPLKESISSFGKAA
jgi:phasin